MHTNSNSEAKSSALLAHIISQTQSNIDFLVSQNYLRASDAAGILSKLSALSEEGATSERPGVSRNATGNSGNGRTEEQGRGSPVLSVAERMRHLSVNGHVNGERDGIERAPSPPKAVMSTSLRRAVPPPAPAPRTPQARALWDYNENGSDPNDLSFRAGDIIDIVSETNADWWTGRINNKQGLFPSNYVEKLPSASDNGSRSPIGAPIPVPEPMGGMFGQPSRTPSYSSSPAPPFPNAGPASYNRPPQPSWQAQPYGYGNEKQQQMYAPPPQGPPAAPPPPQAEPKKSKFGGLGNTMANSAAGGVGFGAGAAVGSGIINSIF
ncbi:uncharacterized protein FOMMEDRAFT_138398 [Fomitiporia mediterranea MF3/22]|uniref:uncharacterized protein n=1 Tax=Fomitiporia mediterranea (strain MF3/22) TaxID=694068 RepID=UPI0004408454|nr:uncharacterized protein FOMMEDRAFT_138398 [Fomitiporia mediterranea MF3/22]EJD06422.1 hypothetical protein FOMMEDRAFT_138398 [Fomitiporia mediterranea MF3/22]